MCIYIHICILYFKVHLIYIYIHTRLKTHAMHRRYNILIKEVIKKSKM